MAPVSWFIQILNMSLGAAWAALLVMIGRLLLRRAPKVFSYALWGVVLFRLVCPVSFTSVLSLMPKPRAIPQDIIYAAQPEVESGFVFFDQAVNNSLPPATPAASINPVQLWLELGNLVWQAGMALMLLYCLLSYLRFLGRLQGAVRLEGRVWESDRIPTAFVLGLFRPRIYLPLGLGEAERRYILCHEETHIRRLDHIIKPAALMLLVVHWFNPVLWLAYFLMCRDMEMSCDELAMGKLGPELRKDYSACLLSLSVRQSGLAVPLAFGENDVKSRIKNILNYKKPALWVMAAALALALLLGFCLASDPDGGSGFMLLNPAGDGWVPLSRQEGIPYHDAVWGESIRVERRDAGEVPLTDEEQVKRLGELVSGLEVSKKPLLAGEAEGDWELRLTFHRPDAAGVGDFSLCFTSGQVWGEDGEARRYRLRESVHLFRVVEEYTFLTDPGQAGEYQVGFMEFREGEAQPYVTVTEPTVGSRLASLLLDGTRLEEIPGEVPPTGDYLFISMGDPGTTYYVYENQGRCYMERPSDYRLELSREVYGEIMDVWQTISWREAPDQGNGYYTGFQEMTPEKQLQKFTSYQGETATRLAELILGGEDVPLNPRENEVPADSCLRIEIREPGNAYYIYEDQGHYYAEQLMNYRVELTGDAYWQIRDIYLDAAMDNIAGQALSFYAEGELADIARVGVEGYFDAFTGDSIPEELRILNFTVGEITPIAGTPEEFAVSFYWDYDTTESSRWISANGNGVPAADFAGWHWTGNYQEFRFRRVQGKLYTILGIGTGGGGQGLAPIGGEADGGDLRQQAAAALTALLSNTAQQVEELNAAIEAGLTGSAPSGGEGMGQGGDAITGYLTERFGDVMTARCIERLIADRVFTRLPQRAGPDTQARGLELAERSGAPQLYDFFAELITPEGVTATTAKGTVTMEQEGEVWKASRVTVTLAQ